MSPVFVTGRKSAQNGQLPKFPKSSFFPVRRQARRLSLQICLVSTENRLQKLTQLSISVFCPETLASSIPLSLSPLVTASSPLSFKSKKCTKPANFPTSRRLRSSQDFPFFAQARRARDAATCHTAASGNNAAAIQSLDDRITAELASKLDSSALAPAIAPLATAAALATTDGQAAAHGSSIAALQSSLTTDLSNKADQSAFDVLEGVVATKSTPDSVDLKLSNYSTTAAMNGSIASANNATLATAAANYGLKTVVDQHSLDPLGVVSAAALASELASRDALGLQASMADASALTAYALQLAVDTSSEVDLKIAAALLDAVTTIRQPWTPPSSARRTPARWPPCSPRWTGWTRHWRWTPR